MWKEKFYRPAREGTTVVRKLKKGSKDITQQQIDKYFNTMYMRFEVCRSVAPFWHILNYGTPEYSDKTAGVAYPSNVRTDFVGEARRRISRRFTEFKRQFTKEIEKEYKRIKDTYLLREKQVDRLVANIERKIQELSIRHTPPPGIQYAEEMNYLNQHLGDERFLRADRAKLLYLARALQEGQYIPPRIGLGGQVRARTIRLVRRYRRGQY